MPIDTDAPIELLPDWEARLAASILGGTQDEHIAVVRRHLAIAKVEGAAEYIAAQPGQLLVLHWHVDAGLALAQALRLRGRRVETITGATGSGARDAAVRSFQGGHGDILLGQIIAMGSAINLQANCRHVIFAERSYSPRDMRQAFARVWRMGQTSHVQVDYLDAQHPVDDATVEILTRKQIGYDILTGDLARSA